MGDREVRDRLWAILWIGAIVGISLGATFLRPALFVWANQTPGVDKACHFLLVGGMSYWVVRALAGPRRGPVFWGGLIVVLVGLDEVSQAWISTRSFSLLDLLANVAGATSFSALAARHLRRRGEGRAG